MANRYLRGKVDEICEKKGLPAYFADPKYSSDNASGNAFAAYMAWKKGEESVC